MLHWKTVNGITSCKRARIVSFASWSFWDGWSLAGTYASLDRKDSSDMADTNERGYDLDIFCAFGRRIPLTVQLRSPKEDDGVLPRLILSRRFAERIELVVQDLPDCIFLFLCLLAVASLFTASEDDIISDIRSVRHDLGLLLAQSSQRFNEVSSAERFSLH